MNAELTKKALELVGNPSTLVNLMSRRVRQLTGGGGGLSRPLVEPPVGAGLADIALLEIIEGKITFESIQDSPSYRLDVEVIDDDPHPYACVLNRFNVGYRSMTRIMDKLMDRLEEPRAYRPSAQSPPGGEPESS